MRHLVADPTFTPTFNTDTPAPIQIRCRARNVSASPLLNSFLPALCRRRLPCALITPTQTPPVPVSPLRPPRIVTPDLHPCLSLFIAPRLHPHRSARVPPISWCSSQSSTPYYSRHRRPTLLACCGQCRPRLFRAPFIVVTTRTFIPPYITVQTSPPVYTRLSPAAHCAQSLLIMPSFLTTAFAARPLSLAPTAIGARY